MKHLFAQPHHALIKNCRRLLSRPRPSLLQPTNVGDVDQDARLRFSQYLVRAAQSGLPRLRNILVQQELRQGTSEEPADCSHSSVRHQLRHAVGQSFELRQLSNRGFQFLKEAVQI